MNIKEMAEEFSSKGKLKNISELSSVDISQQN